MKMDCPSGHPMSISFNRWKYRKGSGCSVCAKKLKPVNKLSNGFVKQELLKEGYTLLSKYTRSNEPFEFKCNKGHYSNITWNNWKQGHRCRICANNVRMTLSRIKIALDKEGYILLSEQYINAHSKIKVRCNKGHTYLVTWNK